VPTRAKAIITHEDMEYRTGSHDLAVEFAPETDPPVGRHARRLQPGGGQLAVERLDVFGNAHPLAGPATSSLSQ
jgi:hypothetical protein